MKLKYRISILLLICSFVSSPANAEEKQLADSISLGYGLNEVLHTSSRSVAGVGAGAFENASAIDVSKSLYGKIAGLNVYQGSGTSSDNVSSLQVHGKSPLVLVDGFPRSISDLTSLEIESVYLLTDAASTAMYGVRGANGVLMITTKRGNSSKLKVNAQYTYGLNTQFRSPRFADAYTFASSINEALAMDGLDLRYSDAELNAFKTGLYPDVYPNVNWWKETLNDFGHTHSLKLSFDGGNDKFRYYTVVDYYRDQAMFKENTDDLRYSTKPTDTRLSVRTNIDVEVTKSTFLKVSLAAKLQELNGTLYGLNNMMSVIYGTPSAAFPIKTSEGIYGGNAIYGEKNPVALLMDKGHKRNIYGTLLADMSLKQNLDIVTKGLAAEVRVAFDNIGGMYETSEKTYRYMDINPVIYPNGTLVTTPIYYGADSQTLGHNQPFEKLTMRTSMQANITYDRTFGKHDVHAAAIYDMQSVVANGRNNSHNNLSAIFNAAYSYGGRYVLDAVLSYSGSSYLPTGKKFHTYPAVSAAWVISNENFMKGAKWLDLLKVRASYGLSGCDWGLSHEMWRQAYGSGNSYIFGDKATGVSGGAEGSLPVVGLVPEKSEKITLGLDFAAFRNRLSITLDGYKDHRHDVLVSGTSSTSGIIGIGVGQVCEGEYLYEGFDATIGWNDRVGDFTYGIGARGSYLVSEVINENQAYQEYDYLYHTGNRVGQCYGLEAIGFFESQMEINNSPQQTFSTVRPGDVKYKDQNGDNVIDSKDVVKMFGSTLPRFYFGFDIHFGYKGFEIQADFQGKTGVTVNLLNSPLYKPLINNGNLSQTYLDKETPWTYENRSNATMPRLTTEANENNYRSSSLYYRDGSFIKLRNLVVSYTFPKSMIRFADMKVFVQGCNLFSLDNIGFADPEQLQAAYPSVRTWWAGVKFNF